VALKSIIHKAGLQVSDMDRNRYGEYVLTIARHPSETDERMMMRCLAFACHAHEQLVFAKGLSDIDEPDLWQKDLTGAIDIWIEVGQPDEKRILKACGRATEVVVYSYGSNSGNWWNQVKAKTDRAKNLTVINLPVVTSLALSKLARRAMKLQCTIQDGQIWFSGDDDTVHFEPTVLKTARHSSNQ
jgi:uncharacterized protein YaeQ